MIIVIILLVVFIAVFAVRFTTLEGRKKNKHRQMEQAKNATFKRDQR